jgi:hypothetical protein
MCVFCDFRDLVLALEKVYEITRKQESARKREGKYKKAFCQLRVLALSSFTFLTQPSMLYGAN